jgi:PAS domain S-box-containing protein
MAQRSGKVRSVRSDCRDSPFGAVADAVDSLQPSAPGYGPLPHLQLIYETAPIGLAFLTPDCHYVYINKHLTEICGISIADHIGRSVRETVPQVADQVERIVQTIVRTGEPITGIEVNGQRPDGSNTDRVWITHWHPLKAPGGEVLGINVAAEEITDRKRAETNLAVSEKALRELNEILEQREVTRQLLLRELNHRVKNTLAIVQAMVQQTLRNTRDPADFSRTLTGRIHSLARVHSLLTDTEWQGADLRELILDQLVQKPAHGTRISLSGSSIQLQPQATLRMALMLHELGTNSLKYGALSAPRGRLSVNWTVSGDTLDLRWVERGGPKITAPIRRSFGTTLIEQSAKSEGGRAAMFCAPEGVTWEISLLLSHSSAKLEQPEALLTTSTGPLLDNRKTNGGPPYAMLHGLRFLVVEDEPLVALDLVDSLQKAGAEVAPPVSTDQAALAVIKDAQFDVAVLDINLHGRSADAVATALLRRNIPFICVTGYRRENLLSAFKDAVILSKPVSDQQLLHAVCGLFEKTDRIQH